MSAAVAMLNVENVEAFVGAAVRKVGCRVHEREDLQAEGLLIMCELLRKYTPAHGARGWSFSSYAGEYLPRRLRSARHVMRRGEDVRGRDADGSCVWRHFPPIGSWDQELESPAFSEIRLRRVGRFERRATGAAA